MIGNGDGGDRRSMNSVQEEIVAELAELDDPLEKYEHLVDLGNSLEVPAVSIRDEAHAVPGCQSRVWMVAELNAGRLRILADSDAAITRGMIALLLRVLDDRTPAEILDADLFFLERTGLRAQLSPSRANGLAAMVGRIHELAEEAAAAA